MSHFVAVQLKVESHCDMQRKFMETGNSPMGTVEAVKLAQALIEEEVNAELLPAIGRFMQFSDGSNPEKAREALVELVDGAVDSVYVIYQLMNAMGIDFDACFAEVHRSNMSKFVHDEMGGLTALKREDGKILKGDNYSPPNLAAIIFKGSDQTQKPADSATAP